MSNKKQTSLRLSVLAIGVLCALPAMADEGLKISGFGTLGATYFSRDDADFAGGSGVQSGVGRSARVGLSPDTRFGLQAIYEPIKNLSFTVQAVSKLRPSDDWNPTIEWANVKYQFNDNYALRIGRIGHPFFMASDYLNARYVQTALRPAQEVYGQTPFSASDVVELLANWNVGDGLLSFQGGFGRIKADTIPSCTSSLVEAKPTLRALCPTFANHDEAEVKKIGYFNVAYELDAWTFRAGLTHGNLTYVPRAAQPLFGGLTRLSNGLAAVGLTDAAAIPAAIRDQYETKDQPANFFGFGVNYNDGVWVGNAEYVQINAGKSYNSARAWSLLAGRRFGQVTPYVRYSESNTIEQISAAGIVSKLTPFSAQLAQARTRPEAIQGGIQGLADATAKDQRTFSLGLRWDFRKNMALKAQYDYIQPQTPSASGYLVNTSRDYPAQGKGHAASVAVDFIF